VPLTFQPYKPGPVPTFADPAAAVFLDEELNRIGLALAALTDAVDGIDIPEPPDEPQGLVPPGAVVGWPGDTTPAGNWIWCDGSLYLVADWPLLFAAIGAIYGGDGVTDFAVPDYRGEFLRGTDRGAGVDPDAGARTDRGDGTGGDVIGSRQGDEFRAHNHSANSQVGPFNGQPAGGVATIAGVTGDAGGNETRGRNVYTDWFIYAGAAP